MFIKILGIVIIVGITFVALSLGVYHYDCKKRMKNRTAVTKIALNSVTLSGEPFDTSKLAKNKITLIHIWGTYCGFCIKEMPDLQYVFDKYKDKQIGVLGVVIDLPTDTAKEKSISDAKRIIQENGITYPNIYLDRELKEYLSDKVFLVPTTIFVDQNGNVVRDMVENVCYKSDLEKIMEKLLEKMSAKKDFNENEN